MNDAKEYSVKYDGTEVKFTATDGVVADVALDKITIVKGSAGSVVKAQFLDKNNIVVKEFTLSDAKSEGSVDYSFTENKGYTDGDKLVLLNTGDTATAEVTYHTLKYDQTTGAETGKITKRLYAIEATSSLQNGLFTCKPTIHLFPISYAVSRIELFHSHPRYIGTLLSLSTFTQLFSPFFGTLRR